MDSAAKEKNIHRGRDRVIIDLAFIFENRKNMLH